MDQSVGDPARDLEAGEKGFKCLMCRLAARDTATGLLVERGQERSIEEGAEKALMRNALFLVQFVEVVGE